MPHGTVVSLKSSPIPSGSPAGTSKNLAAPLRRIKMAGGCPALVSVMLFGEHSTRRAVANSSGPKKGSR